MGNDFKSADRETPYLMPPSLSEWLPEDHLAWFIVVAVKKLNLSMFRGRYRADGLGASAYDPELMVGLMLTRTALGSARRVRLRRHVRWTWPNEC